MSNKSCENCIKYPECEVAQAILLASDGGGFLYFSDMDSGKNNGMEAIADICWFWKDKGKELMREWREAKEVAYLAKAKLDEYYNQAEAKLGKG